MKRLLIIACSATKRPDAGELPAIDRYDGPAYRVLRKWQRERPDQAAALDVLILSAEFGLIASDQPIPDYDRRMDARRARVLAPTVRAVLRAHLHSHEVYGATLVNVGGDYAPALDLSHLEGLGAIAHTRGGVGERLGQLKRWLNASGA